MSELIDIIISAIDQASDTFAGVQQSADDMASGIESVVGMTESDFGQMEASVTGFQSAIDNISDQSIQELASDLEMSTSDVEALISAGANAGSISFNDATASVQEFDSSINAADSSMQGFGSNMDILNSSALLDTAQQLGQIGAQAEGMAQEINSANITVGQLAIQTGMAEPQLRNLVSTISNATFPQQEAMMYIKSLDQMGVSAQNLGASATGLDRINDAFHLGAEKTNQLGQELGVLGVDMNNVSSAFNALAYANDNTVGGMENFFNFLRRFDSQFNELGFDVDQTSIAIAAATQKFGGGRAALTGLSKALKESGGDTRKLEQALGIQAGTLDKASQVTGKYKGTLESMAKQEGDHKTIIDQLGAAYEDLTMTFGDVGAAVGGFMGIIGQVGSFAIGIKAIKDLSTALKETELYAKLAAFAETVLAGVQGVLAGGLGAAAAAAWSFTAALLANPLTWIVIAIIAVVAALYELGVAFGWWSDVASMLDALWAGIQRLWSAFINHPDVQAAIQAISSELKGLYEWINGAVKATLEFFGISTSGEFDVIHELIMGVGHAWDFLKETVGGVIDTISTLIEVTDGVVTGQMDMQTATTTIWETLRANIGPIARAIGLHVIRAFTGMRASTVMSTGRMFNGVLNYFKRLPGRVAAYMKSTLLKMVASMKQWVLRSALYSKQVLTKVVTYIKQLPGKVGSYVTSTASKIATAGAKWVSNAKTSAQNMVNAVKNKVSTLPGVVYREFMNIGPKIYAAGSALANAAAAAAKRIVDAFKRAAGMRSPGYIQRATVKEFEDTVGRIYEQVRPMEKAGGAMGAAMVKGFGDPKLNTPSILDKDRDLTISTNNNKKTTYSIDENYEIKLKHELDLKVGLENVPENVDENRLLSIVEKAFANPKVMRKLVESNVFQEADSKMKQNILNKRNRSQGIWSI